jgi:hypothetical protein
MVKFLQFTAIIVSALALIPSGAHLAALSNKIALPPEQYFTVQAIYRGWAFLGALWPAALLANAGLAYIVRAQPVPLWLAVAAAFCFAVMIVIFMLWTFPANQATENWTSVPADWRELRKQWEYSHAVNTLIVFAALCLSTLSVVTADR